VYFVVFLVVASLGIAAYADYQSLVAGWGDEILIEQPPKAAIVGPAIKAVGKLMMECYSEFATDSYDSGIVCSELLRLAYLGLSSTDDLR
jgi:hypothetical protein